MFLKNRVAKSNVKPFGFYPHLNKQRQLSNSKLYNILKKTNSLTNLNKDLLQKIFLKELNIGINSLSELNNYLINLTRESNLSSSRKVNKSLKNLLAEKLSSKLSKRQTKSTNTFGKRNVGKRFTHRVNRLLIKTSRFSKLKPSYKFDNFLRKNDNEDKNEVKYDAGHNKKNLDFQENL